MRIGVSAGAILAGELFLPVRARAQAAELRPLQRFPRMMQEHLGAAVRACDERRRARLATLRDKADAEAYVEEVRGKILQSFGPLPEKTPLNARVTGVLRRDAYSIEKLIFESRPGFLVTANLYLPAGLDQPAPGVVGVCGHSTGGKAEAAYQSFCQGLARKGFVVLIIDPISQGERLQYVDSELRSRIGVGVREHLYAGNQQFLVDEFLGTWRAWDGIRALDYLLTRPEVDARHVGITGNSGGGTMTTWLCGLERRWTMAAPSCFVTTFRRNFENELPADTEQCPPRALALGLDHEDFIAAMAPKPVILLGKERDFFDIRGTEAAYARLRKLYRLLGAEGNIAMFAGPTTHGFSQENREAMYGWFERAVGWDSDGKEPELTLEEERDLWCTPDGQVAPLGSRTIFSYTAEKSKSLAEARVGLTGAGLRSALNRLLRLPAVVEPPDYRIMRPLSGRGHPQRYTANYAVETEPGAFALLYMPVADSHQSRIPQADGDAVVTLYVGPRSIDQELREPGWARGLAEAAAPTRFFACDLRGLGDSKPETCDPGSFDHPYGSDYFYAIHGIMLDRPYPAQRTRDLLGVIALLASRGYTRIHLAASGWGTIPATFAAVLSEHVVQVSLKGAMESFAAIAESEDYDWPLSSFVPGVLGVLDLPDCYAALVQKGLQMVADV